MLTQGMNAIHPLEPGSMDLEELYTLYGDKISFVGKYQHGYPRKRH